MWRNGSRHGHFTEKRVKRRETHVYTRVSTLDPFLGETCGLTSEFTLNSRPRTPNGPPAELADARLRTPLSPAAPHAETCGFAGQERNIVLR